MTGDPHFTGAHGDLFSFRGGNNTIYAMHSSRHLQVNARFVPETFVMGGSCDTCHRKLVHGSFVKSVYVLARSTSKLDLRIEYHADEPSHVKLTVSAEHTKVEMPIEVIVSKYRPDEARPRVVDELTVVLSRKHQREAGIKVSNDEFIVEAASRFLGWAEQNRHKKRLDIGISSRKKSASLNVAPHGLVGQSFDADDVAVDGAVDDYSGSIVVTQAMGEGAIEGTAEDYEIDSTNPFSTDFKFTRFHAVQASPRDVSALTGFHRKAHADKSESATMLGDDTLVDDEHAASGSTLIYASS